MMRNILLSVLLWMPSWLNSQPSTIVQLGVEQGLSNNYVVSITQDKDGFLWFATEEGLNKFDGSRFINYYKHNNCISGNELNQVYADPVKPIIWVATQRAGLNAFNYEQNTLTTYTHDNDNAHSIITNDVTRIAPASNENLWISTYHRGIELFNKEHGTFTHYNTTTIPNLISDNTWTVAEVNKEHLYVGHVGHGMSIISLKDKRVKNFRHHPSVPGSIPGNDVRCIYEDGNSNIWVGTDKGMALFHPETEKFITLDNRPGSPLSSYIYGIRQLDNRKLWVGTELNGICIVDIQQHIFMSPDELSVQHITVGSNKYSLSNPTVRSIFQDSFQNIWIGTYGGGINFIGKTQPLFDTYTYSPISGDINSLNNRVVLSLCTDSQNKLWIGTDGGGVNVFDKGKRIDIYDKESGHLTHNSVLASFCDSHGTIWLGTFTEGLNLYDHQKKSFQRIRLNGKTNLDVRSIYEDDSRNLWIGTNIGVFVLDPAQRKVIHHYDQRTCQLPEDFIRSIAQDGHGQMWIGTFGQGLAVYSPEMKPVAEFNEHNGFCSNTINHIFKDSRKRMWIATGEGLACFPAADSLGYRVFQREDGLLNTFIRAITEDESGNIWFSTNAGISCYLNDLQEFRNYNYFDKTPMGSFISNAVTKDENGLIYFGSINGARFFDPVLVLSSRKAPPITITGMQIYEGQSAPAEHKEITYFSDHNRTVRLTYKQNTFNILFNVQDYSMVNQVDYAYQLKGLDDSWYTISENNIMFRNIPPGSYEFRVRTLIRNQEWEDQVSSLFITITPPLWLSWWAKTIYSMLAALILIALLHAYKKRVDIQSSYELEKKNREQEQELNHERLRFYTNITHELRTPLTLILGPLEDLQKDTTLLPKQTQKISVVRQSAVRLLNLINQILEFRKTETQNKKLCVSKDNIATLIKEIGLRYRELNRKADVEFSFWVQEDELILYFDKEIITIILDNLIANAIKYTDKGQIELKLYTTVKEDVSYTEIQVTDTGYGISPEEIDQIFDRYYQARSHNQASGTGIGLSLVKNLTELHEGNIRVESIPNQGSSFYFSLLTHNSYPNALHADVGNSDAAEEIAEITGSQAETLPDNNKPILLVVEDNADIRDYIEDSFSDSFEVITANEGEEGCLKAFAHIPDIIVSDIMMPGMDGIMFCKKVKEDIRTSHVPVILLTAKDSLQDKEEGYVAGADSYLTKPFSATLLHSRINNLLEARRKLAIQYSSNLNTAEKSNILKESLNQLDNEFLQNITQLVEENLSSEKVDVAYLADKMFMSNSTLYRKIKALTGISTNEYVRKIKMKNAERLLLEGKYSISEITFRVGINSPVYFRQCFKDEFGISPSEYLKRLK